MKNEKRVIHDVTYQELKSMLEALSEGEVLEISLDELAQERAKGDGKKWMVGLNLLQPDW